MALVVRIKSRAHREIEGAAVWWAENRPAALGAIRKDVEAALALLVEEPGIGTKIKTARSDTVRRLYLTRIRYFSFTTASAGSFLMLSHSGTLAAKRRAGRWILGWTLSDIGQKR